MFRLFEIYTRTVYHYIADKKVYLHLQVIQHIVINTNIDEILYVRVLKCITLYHTAFSER